MQEDTTVQEPASHRQHSAWQADTIDGQLVADAADLIAGLTSQSQKCIPSRFSYSDEGSALYEQLCEQPEYYLTRTERRLLGSSAASIARQVGNCDIYELGAGNSEKTALLLRAVETLHSGTRYHPIDVNSYILAKGKDHLSQQLPALRVLPLVATYDQALAAMHSASSPAPRTIIFLGSSFGNFRPPQRDIFLGRVRDALRPGEHFLLSSDLDKPAEILTAAYNDRAGVLARMELGVLRTLNGLYDGTFDPADFRHLAFHNAAEMRVESHLQSRRNHEVTLAKLGLRLHLAAGETICNDVMYKPTLAMLEGTLAAAGFAVVGSWMDERTPYVILLLRRI